jgi:NAD(P)-dependent dehydrogenase (short-subunit alcohol dehydrogenase family)
VDTNKSKDGGEIQAIISGVHYCAAKSLIIAPTARARAPKEGGSENSISNCIMPPTINSFDL